MSMGLVMGCSIVLPRIRKRGHHWRLAQVIAAIVALAFTLPGTASADSAEGGATMEWRKGSVNFRVYGPSVSRSVAKKLRKKIKKTNLGGLRKKRRTKRATAARTGKNSRKARSRSRAKSRRVRVASLGNSFKLAVAARKGGQAKKPKSITGGARGVTWVANKGCLNGRLKSAIYHVARTYGRVRVNSTCRSRRHNRRVGGARKSHHLTGNAADIRIWGNVRAAARYLRSIAGGYKHYGGGLFHIDTGPRRSW